MDNYQKFLKSFVIPRIISNEEIESPEFDMAIKLKHADLGIVFKDKLYPTLSLTDKGYRELPMSWFYKTKNWIWKVM